MNHDYLVSVTSHSLIILQTILYIVAHSKEEKNKMLRNGTCNVMSSDQLLLWDLASNEFNASGYVVGKELKTKEPLSIVTRQNDREFSDVINWVIQAMFYGEEQGLTKNSTLCQEYTETVNASDLNFLNAVYCVGNYAQVVSYHNPNQSYRGMNRINDGTSGMLYAIPLGQLNEENTDISLTMDTLYDVKGEGELNCGILVPDNFTIEDILVSDGLVGMSVDYCKTLSASLYNGDPDAVNFFPFEEDGNAYAALENETIDVIAGARIEKKYDLGQFRYSTPYYFGDEAAR